MPVLRTMVVALPVVGALVGAYLLLDKVSPLPGEWLRSTPNLTADAKVAADMQKQVLLITSSDSDCGASATPHVAVTQQPTKGFISFESVPTVALNMSLHLLCVNWRAPGIGVIYNAGFGTTGSDTFTISALRADGGVATHAVHVIIED
jgi:hypothetical protein